MPHITQRISYNGFDNLVSRHGLDALVGEVEGVIAGFTLMVEPTKHANGTKPIRVSIDEGFKSCGGWTQKPTGGVDWSKSGSKGGRVGVEVQVSGRSDLLAVDVLHLMGELQAGNLDIGIIIVPDDELSPFLTDRTPNLRTAKRHVETHASKMPLQLIAFIHDETGIAIPKARTNLGRVGS